MSYPTPSDYQDAVQTPETAFADPELQAATPRTNVLGLPQPITGAFAAVFPMTTDTGARVAAKCFLAERPDLLARYQAIAAHLAEANLDATVGFDMQARGIRVNGEAYPLLKMEWAAGTNLNRFVERHLDAPDTLRRLADAWADALAALEGASVAHGDLQHDNVLVQTEDGAADGDALRLRLVDYDTMYVPALDGRDSPEVGHRNYQHPDRTDADFGPALDRFAGLVVYTALQACAVRPALWDEHDTGENLLFRDADFYNPDTSPLFDALTEIDALQPLPQVLRRACFVEPEAVPPLADVRDGTASTERPTVSARRSRRDETDARRTRDPFVQWFLPGSSAVLLAVIGLAGGGLPVLASIVAACAVGVGGWQAAAHYRRLPVVRRRRRLTHEIDRLGRRIETLARQVESLQAQRREVLSTVEAQREARLREVQDEALYDRLKHHFVGEAREVEGVTHKHVVRLKAAGIRTAYEARPEEIAAIRTIGDEAQAQLRMWRAALVQEYEDEIPDELSPAEDRRLQRYVEHRIEDIDAEVARTREKIEVQRIERERLQERLDEMPDLTPGRYVRALLRLDALPSPTGDRPVPTPHGANDRTAAPDEQHAEPLPELSSDEDRPWWKQAS